MNNAPSPVEPTLAQPLGGFVSDARELLRQALALAKHEVHAELHETKMAKENIQCIRGKTISDKG